MSYVYAPRAYYAYTNRDARQYALAGAASQRIKNWGAGKNGNDFDQKWWNDMVAANDGDTEHAIEWAMDYSLDIERRFEDSDLESDEADALGYAAIRFMEAEVGAGNHFDYIVQMNDAWKRRGYLTVGQVRGLLNCLRAAAVKREKSIENADDDLAFRDHLPNIIAAFKSAQEKGVKKARIRFLVGDVKAVIYPAAPYSKNAGSFYVKEQGPYGSDATYYGKVTATGEVDKVLERNSAVVDALRALNGDFIEAMKEYGRVTGSCAICGRTLTDKASIALGIGPICMEKVGF